MANHKSAKKCIRKAQRRTLINRNRISRIRTYIKAFEEIATSAQNHTAEQMQEAFITAQREIMRGVRKGVIHRNTAARKISNFAKKLKAIAA